MLTSGIPTAKFPKPFADGAGPSYIRPIPTPSQIGITNGAASLTDGFPPLNAQPVGAGGVPPFMQDFNGLLNQITAWTRWYNAGGPIGYDAAFSQAVGGYPKGAIIAAASFPYFWFNTVDGNTTNPDTGGAGWVQFTPTGSSDSSLWHVGTAALGSANTYTATLAPVPASGAANFYCAVLFPSTNTGAATFNGAAIVLDSTGAALNGNELRTIGRSVLFFDGTSYRLINPSLAASVAATKIWDYTFDGTATSAICPIGSLAPGKSVFRITAFAPGNGSTYSYLGARISYDGSTFLSSGTGYLAYFSGTISNGGFNANTLAFPCGWYSGGGNGYGTAEGLFFAGNAQATASFNGTYQIRSTSTNFAGNRDMGVFMGNAQTPVGPALAIQFLGTGSYAAANGSLIAAGTRIIVEVING